MGPVVAWLALFLGYIVSVKGLDFNYTEALSKSIIFLEAQRSGKLPSNNRVPWRGDSGLDDGKEANEDLVGGYYDAGDNVKYGLPMAFTITTLAWSAIAYQSELESACEWKNVKDAIRWGTDYFLKTASRHRKLYVEVGDPVKDHKCWMRPENLKGPRRVLQIDEKTPGSEIAGETSAAMAASSMVFRHTDALYARELLKKAKRLFRFAKDHKKTFDGECPFYCSFSGFNDELSWAAAWLYSATHRIKYFKYLTEEAVSASVDEFNWDLKFAGTQILLSKFFFEGTREFRTFNENADSYICSVLPQSPYHETYMTPGGLLHLRDGANLQYATGASLLFSVYGDLLKKFNRKIKCGNKPFESKHLLAFAKQQMDYILGRNPQQRSYMVGFGKNPPKQAHHRGASIPLSEAKSNVDCGTSFTKWFNRNAPNPNELTGAILGGPDKKDKFSDLRWTSVYTEPCTYVNSLAVGALAKLTRPLQKS
ncbi:hypothetical protein V6N12_067592 [Hibiscus sabdariffa]|uniref:Endoglucanase n=1 Tax=Hibiscus sabdariffa TaxID=183260 RepID=A0ABR2B8A4_9ROSI